MCHVDRLTKIGYLFLLCCFLKGLPESYASPLFGTQDTEDADSKAEVLVTGNVSLVLENSEDICPNNTYYDEIDNKCLNCSKSCNSSFREDCEYRSHAECGPCQPGYEEFIPSRSYCNAVVKPIDANMLLKEHGIAICVIGGIIFVAGILFLGIFRKKLRQIVNSLRDRICVRLGGNQHPDNYQPAAIIPSSTYSSVFEHHRALNNRGEDVDVLNPLMDSLEPTSAPDSIPISISVVN